jgi:hypothetical protein
MPDGAEPITDLPIVGHGGVVDVIRHATASAGMLLSALETDTADDRDLVEDLRGQLRTLDSVAALLNEAGWAGHLTLPSGTEDASRRWKQRLADDDFDDAERAVLAFMARCRR